MPKCCSTGCENVHARHHLTKYSYIRILLRFPLFIFFNCKYMDSNASVKKQHDNVSYVTPFICVTFKTTSQEGRFYHRTIMFPVIQRYCSADVKILVLSFTFAPQKSTKKMPKHVANSSSFQHSDAHVRILFTRFIYIWDSGTSKRSVHSVVRCYLAVNTTLIVNSISNSEQTDKSVC